MWGKKGVLVLCCLFATAVLAQNGDERLKFSEKGHEFHNVKEGGGTVSHTFLITNLVEETACILRCEPDPQWNNIRLEWDTARFQKHERIRLKATLNPIDMRGNFQIPFNCIIRIGKDSLITRLYLKGYVCPTPTTKEELYSLQEGHLKYIRNTASFACMEQKTVVRDTFRFYNVWDSVMTFKVGKLPASIRIEQLTPEVGPEEEGFVVFSFSAEAMNDWGHVFDRFTLLTNDPIPASHAGKKTFYVTAEIYDDFSHWSAEQLKNAPHLLVEEQTFDFGSCISGEEVRHDFKISNIGKSNLIIRKVKTSCGCTTSKLEKETLAPGESTMIKTVFRTAHKKGRDSKEISIICNDPDQPQTTLIITGNIQEAK